MKIVVIAFNNVKTESGLWNVASNKSISLYIQQKGDEHWKSEKCNKCPLAETARRVKDAAATGTCTDRTCSLAHTCSNAYVKQWIGTSQNHCIKFTGTVVAHLHTGKHQYVLARQREEMDKDQTWCLLTHFLSSVFLQFAQLSHITAMYQLAHQKLLQKSTWGNCTARFSDEAPPPWALAPPWKRLSSTPECRHYIWDLL